MQIRIHSEVELIVISHNYVKRMHFFFKKICRSALVVFYAFLQQYKRFVCNSTTTQGTVN